MPINHLGKNSDEIRRFGRQLINKYGETEPTFEAAGGNVLHDIYREFKNEQGEPLFALMRMFRLCRHEELPPEIKGGIDPAGGKHWLALVATIGQEPAWNDRRQSEKHGVIAPNDFASPMLKAAFEQMNLDPFRNNLPNAVSDMILIQEPISPTRYFLVQQALGNPNIVEQDAFVKPYGIGSVLGMGCAFDSGALLLTLLFARIELSNTDIQLLMQLAPYISTMMATYDDKGVIWNPIKASS